MLTKRIKRYAALGVLITSYLGVVNSHRAAADTAQNEALKAIKATYEQRDAAASRLDFDGFWKYRTDNFVWISKDGRRRNINELKQGTAKLFNAAESMNGRAVIQQLTLKGNTATVLIRDSGTIVIPVSATKKNVLKITERASDTWVKRNGRWLHAQSKSLSAYVTLNGKPVKY